MKIGKIFNYYFQTMKIKVYNLDISHQKISKTSLNIPNSLSSQYLPLY
jgi:hypothetical protein